MNWKKIIKRETENSRMTIFQTPEGKEYHYVILPFESRMSHEFRNAMLEGLEFMLKDELKKADTILALEAKGFFPAVLFAQKFKKDLAIVRKRDYKIKSQIKINQKKAYGEGTLYCVGLKKSDKILIIDDIISSGGTLITTIKALKGYNIVGIASVYERNKGSKILERETGLKAKSLAKFEVLNGRPKIKSFYNGR
jgi:adenine phosphoribosyltransferase